MGEGIWPGPVECRLPAGLLSHSKGWLVQIAAREARVNYLLERKVTLSDESKHDSLYGWSISEEPLERGGAKNQIPWAWTLSFEGMDVTLSDIVESDRYVRKDEDGYAPVRHRRAINAKLRPGEQGRRSWNVTRFSFFGTDRTISDIRLNVEELPEGDPKERCEVWGCPSYEYEGADFGTEIQEDHLGFNLFVRPETFARLSTLISLSAVTSLNFRAGSVSGFYSSWSPTILTNHIKILSSMKDHVIDIPAGCSIIPLRLDRAGDFHLSLNSAHDLDNEYVKDEQTTNDQASRPVAATAPSAPAPAMPAADQHNLAGHLSQLRIAAWLIVALLAFKAVF